VLWRRLRVIGLAFLLLGLGWLRVVAARHQLGVQAGAGDLDRFFVIATMPGRPYADGAVEYPPLTVALLDALHLVAPSRTAFGAAVIVLNVALEAGVVAALWWGFGRRAALAFLVLDTLLIDFLTVHLDLAATLGAVVALALWRRHRLVSAGAVLAVAAGIKLWPLALLPFLYAALPQGHRRRLLTGAGAAGGVILAGWLAVAGGLQGIAQVVSFRGARGWQIESSGGALIRLFTHAPAHLESGAHRFGAVPRGIGPLLVITGGVVAVAGALLAARTGRAGIAWIAAAGGLMLGSTLLSPQYVVWLLPGVAIAWSEGDRLPTAPAALAVLLTWVGSFTYGALLGADTLFLAIVVVRNLALLVAVGLALRAALRTSRPLELRGLLVPWIPLRLTERTSVR
jgi:hypothetical protein